MSKVVNIGDVRITRAQRSYVGPKDCPHLNMTTDDDGGIVECDDCKKQLSPYWALQMLAVRYDKEFNKLIAGQQRLQEAKEKDVSLLAAQKVEKAWRSRTMVPMCPHCCEAIFPQDGFGGSATNRELALRRRAIKVEGNKP